MEDSQRREDAREERRIKERAEDIERENNAGGRSHRSVIKIHPQVKWPILEDSDTDPREFYREFEHVCRMCNDGHGMIPKERLTVLLNCLRGHRKKIYNYVLKETYELAQTDQGAEQVYQLFKDRMLEFTETLTEKQTRVQSEFRFLEKGNLTALQWDCLLYTSPSPRD